LLREIAGSLGNTSQLRSPFS
jgi:nucleotide-binding universal stress UspA family protein